MKAWEIFKHLEEDGRMIRTDVVISAAFSMFNVRASEDLAHDIVVNPDVFKKFYPKKKIKLYRYTYWKIDKKNHEQSYWTEQSFKQAMNLYGLERTQCLKTEEKEIEIDSQD